MIDCRFQLFALFFTSIYETFTEPDINKANIMTRDYALIIFSIGVGGGLCQCISSIAFSRSGEALTKRMRIISFSSMLRQEIGWFDREENKLGALVTQLSSDTSSLKVKQSFPANDSFSCQSSFSGSVWTSSRNHVQCRRRGGLCSDHRFRFGMGINLGYSVIRSVDCLLGNVAREENGRDEKDRSEERRKSVMGRERRHGNDRWIVRSIHKLVVDFQIATEAIDSIRTVVGLHQEEYFIDHYEDCFNQEFRSVQFLRPRSISTQPF